MDYNREYDTTKVDTPENRRGMVRLFMKYTEQSDDGSRPVYDDPEGSEDLSVDTYLRVLADYADEKLDKPQSMEKALDMMVSHRGVDTYLAAVINRLRYMEVMYLSRDKDARGYPYYNPITLDDREVYCLTVFSRRKKLPGDIPDWLHVHHIPIYPLLEACAQDGIELILINPDDSGGIFRTCVIKDCIDECDYADAFWDSLRKAGVRGEYLFPLFAQDFAYRYVGCVYGDMQKAFGYATPYLDGQAPGYNIDTGDGTVYVPLESLKFIRTMPDEEDD